jgi:hypothetical protein
MRLARRLTRFLIGSALFMGGTNLMLLGAITVFGLPAGFILLALGLDLMLTPGKQGERAVARPVESPSSAELAPVAERPSGRSDDVPRAA